MEEAYVFPTSFAQQRLWFLDQLAPGSPFYNINTTLRLPYVVDIVVLERSINEIVRRHESLRTTFRSVDGQPVQVIAPTLKYSVSMVDLRHLETSTEREREALRIATEEARHPFNLVRGPLLRATLLQLEANDFVLTVTMHHIISDGWSLDLFYGELSALYDCFSKSQSSPLKPLLVQYADYAVWQAQWLHGARAAQQLEYWKKQLDGLPSLHLPTDHPRPEVQTFLGTVQSFWIPSSLVLSLKELAKKEQGTLFMVLLAAFQVLLHRYSRQDDIVVGAPVANRGRAEIEELIGLFVNSLVLRTDMSGGPSFREVVKRVRRVALDAYDNQEFPFERLVKELQPERDMSRNPLFQVSFQLFSPWDDTTNAEGALEAGPFGGSAMEVEKGTSSVDLALDLWEFSEGLYGRIEYSTDLFNASYINRLRGHLLTLLRDIVADPDQQISALQLLTPDERKQVLVNWNATSSECSEDILLHQLVELQVKRTPDAIAAVLQNEQITYAQLDRRANQLARYLQARCIGPEGLVAVCMERSLEMLVGVLGILKAGAGFLPLDPFWPGERVAFILGDARVALVLSEGKSENTIPWSAVPRLCLDGGLSFLSEFSEESPVIGASPGNLAYVIYTSGSTGTPKGVMVEHHAICNHLLWMQKAFPLTPTDRVPQKYSPGFDVAILEIFHPLSAGARLVLAAPQQHLDRDYFLRLINEQGLTALDLVPSTLEALLEDDKFKECRSVRRIVCGGEALSASLQDAFFSQMDADLSNIYGPTEATIGATAWHCKRGYTGKTVPIGRPVDNTQVYVLDSHLNPVPANVCGEIYIGGTGLARGYCNQPALTAAQFIPNPFANEPGARLYRTGDLARYLEDGNLEYLGRLDDQVKVRGFRIELNEIREALGTLPAVQSTVILVREDAHGHAKIVAYVVPRAVQPELWPSVGEYLIYDELLYHSMSHDTERNRSYQAAMEALVPGKTVVDIGTGRDAILARMCIEAGAKHVYAIEILDDAYRRAKELVETLGLGNVISVLQGDSRRLELPEKVDVCVSDLIGSIGSSEGTTSILNDARRFLKPTGTVIPTRCETFVAAARLPDELVEHPAFTDLSGPYAERIFAKVGHPFDLRVCIRNFPLANVISTSELFEKLDFRAYVNPEHSSPVRLVVRQQSKLHGFLLWLNLYPCEGEPLDSLKGKVNWLPVFFPVFPEGIDVSEGDSVEAICSAGLSHGKVTPDYRVAGRVLRQAAPEVDFDYRSSHHEDRYRHNSFYQALLAEGYAGRYRPRQSSVDSHTLRKHLERFLPEFMLPSRFVILDALPLTSSGKVDRQSLSWPDEAGFRPEFIYQEPKSQVEKHLARIWSEVLGVERVGTGDNFFELGGDSILSLQVVARANTSGIRITPAQIFQYQTINQLAQVANTKDLTNPDQESSSGEVYLTPVQHWFFEQDLPQPHHYNQSILLEILPSVDIGKLTVVLEQLVAHHDALRFRFKFENGWRQIAAPQEEALQLQEFDLTGLLGGDQAAEAEKLAADRQASIDLSIGPLFRAALFRMGGLRPHRLLLAVHHLVIDGVSWRILLEDLEAAYQQLVDGQDIQFPPKSTSFQYWAKKLKEYAESPEILQRVDYWVELSTLEKRPLPRDMKGGANTVASIGTVKVILSVDETRALLRDVAKAFNSQMNDVLLTALVHAFSTWTGERGLTIDLEGHGREDIFENVDLSRTVGWFTAIFPVSLRVHASGDLCDTLRSVKEQLRGVPNHGLDYGVLRYMSPSTPSIDKLRAAPRPEVAFNYLGQFAMSQLGPSWFQACDESPGPTIDPTGLRVYLLEIDGSITGERLEFVWSYSHNIYLESTIIKVADSFVSVLRSLIATSVLGAKPTYAPSDFPKAKLSQESLDKLIARLNGTAKRA